ncbi:MAG: hypothetical protein EXX96DRAFT_553108 [Benjaminiella poitrasii]|nr:MAG: hypothetical protein EXX96DRAFT_553108 [Benjaminiella poitrasii]
MTIDDLDANMLRIAFNTCFTACQYSVNTVTQTITAHTTVPNTSLVACQSLSRVPIYLLVVQDQEKILDSWFIGYFSYFTWRRPSDEFNQYSSNINTMISDTGESKQGTSATHLTSPIAAVAAADTNANNIAYYTSAQSDYYGLPTHAPYIGLPPTQPSSRPKEYFEVTDSSLLSYPPNAFQTSYHQDDKYGTSSMLAATQPQSPPQQQQGSYILPMIDPLSQFSPPPPVSLLPSTSSPSISSAPHPIQIKPAQPSLSLVTAPSTTTVYHRSTQPNSIPTSTATTITPNPFANLLNKPELHIETDLRAMTEDWTETETRERRRLVRFHRRQEDNEISCRCERYEIPATHGRVELKTMIVVSCIEWNGTHYITSVDCIYLLQHLLGVSFTVEEKNRIRRNLEGFQPKTVSKMKPESAEFFKLIMSYPDPKPRNIEKDLKVFRWVDLHDALKKIITKYTASFSSTASVLESSVLQQQN